MGGALVTDARGQATLGVTTAADIDAGLIRLSESAHAAGPLPPGAREKLQAYIALLVKWNATYNLTAIREPERMVTHHILDAELSR